MKIILSRKGFDSSAGKWPSPIFPDGQMLSLPIPDKESPLHYKDISWHEDHLDEIIAQLTGKPIPSTCRAHLDPDLRTESLPRLEGWRPIFGQASAAQGHLRNQSVGSEDLFLFFGLFQETIFENGQLRYKQGSARKHVIWGWLQIDSSVNVDTFDRDRIPWALYHPHFHRSPDKSNSLYISKEKLQLPGLEQPTIRGGGVFSYFSPHLQLTSPGALPGLWKLPKWIYPVNGRPALSYHGNLNRWEQNGLYTFLHTVGRGQEFVINSEYYPELIAWLIKLFSESTT